MLDDTSWRGGFLVRISNYWMIAGDDFSDFISSGPAPEVGHILVILLDVSCGRIG
jgi:hypothetical protein